MASSQIPVINQNKFFRILLTFKDCDVSVFAKAGLTNKMMQISKASHWFSTDEQNIPSFIDVTFDYKQLG